MSKLRLYFFTGLLAVLPVFITLYLLFSGFIFLDRILGKYINQILLRHLGFFIPGLGVILGLSLVLIIGLLVTHLIGKKLAPALERHFLKFPLVKQIYPAVKQMVHFFLSREKPAFKKVVLVEYPSKGIWSLGFITNEGFPEAKDKLNTRLLHVLIPSTPSPFTGWLIIVPESSVIRLEMSVEEAVKFVVSGGIINPGTKHKPGV